MLAQSKTHARSLDVSRDGAQFAAFCADGRVRVWRLKTGKLRRAYDESLEVGGRGGNLARRSKTGGSESPLPDRRAWQGANRQGGRRNPRRSHTHATLRLRTSTSTRAFWQACCSTLQNTHNGRAGTVPPQAAHELQKSGPEALQLEDIDFGRRYALEKEMRAQGGCRGAPWTTEGLIRARRARRVYGPPKLGVGDAGCRSTRPHQNLE